jgi:hypothetical protein
MPGDAVYCPACGAASGALRVEPVGGDAETSSAEVALGSPKRRWLAPAVIAAVVALIVVVAVVGGGRDKPAASPTTSTAPATTTPATTSDATTTTNPGPTTPTTTYAAYAVPPLPDAAGLVVYESTNEGEVLRIDLGTGAIQRRRPPLGARAIAGPWVVLARQGGFAMADGSYDSQSPVYGVLDGPDGAVARLAEWSVEDTGSVPPRVVGAAEPDEVWAWNDTMNGGPSTVKRVRLDGTVTAGPVTLPRYGTVMGADGPGALAVQSAGGFYRATIEGDQVTMERLWPRVPLAYSRGALLDLECNDQLECHLVVVDRNTGAARPVPGDAIDHVVPSFDRTLSADGRWVVNVEYDNGANTTKVSVYDLTTGALVMQDDALPSNYGFFAPGQTAQFSADGRWLAYFNLSGGIRLWKVGSPDPPVTYNVPITIVTMISLAP